MPIIKPALKPILVSVALSIVLFVALSVGSVRGEVSVEPDIVIEDYHSDITIQSGGVALVTETIRVKFEQRRHSIYRDLPLTAVGEYGSVRNTPLKIMSITDDFGRQRKYSIQHKDKILRIDIGQSTEMVKGSEVYVIRYRAENAVEFNEDYDELVWDVTGSYWTMPIRNASARVTVESEQITTRAQATCHVGWSGYEDSACRWETDGNTALFSSGRQINPHEGLRVVFAWDKGLIAKPSGWNLFAYRIDLGRTWIVALVPGTLIIMFLVWFFRGRDPRPAMVSSPAHTPPSINGRPLSAAEVGAIIDEELDLKDISGTVVGLAVKEYMIIEEIRANEHDVPVDYRLMRIREPGQDLTLFEQELMQIFFGQGRLSILFSEVYPCLATYRRRLDKILFDEMTQKGLFPSNPASVRRTYAILGGVILVLAGAVSLISAPTRPAMGLLVGLIAGGIVIAFSRLMPRRTEQGVMAARAAASFGDFLAEAEEIRLDWMKEETLFDYLPYAIALGVAPQWARRFEGEFKEAPRWYRSSVDFSLLGPVKFAATASGLLTGVKRESSP